MNILVVGHEGYVGAGLMAYFAPRHRVTGWGRREDLFRLTPAVLKRLKIDALVNCAVAQERAEARYAVGAPSDRINVSGARHLAGALKGARIAWFQISTREVFGPVYGARDVISGRGGYRPRFLVDEDRPFAPRSVYAKSKLMAEFIAESHPRANVIRLCTCYTGLDHKRGNWMSNMIKAASSGRRVALAGGGRQFRDPLHADDLGRLIEALMKKGVYGEKLNAGGGRENLISVGEFLRLAAPSAKIKKVPGGDYGFAFSNRKARLLTGWSPRVSLRATIPALVETLGGGIVEVP